MRFRSGLRIGDLDFATMLSRANAGFRKSLDDMREVKIKERRTNRVGSLAMEETSSGGLMAGLTVVASWKLFLLERCRRGVLCSGTVRGFAPS